MANQITVRVTTRDIKEGEHNCTACPVALAIGRRMAELGFADDDYVWVEPYGSFVRDPIGIEIRNFWHKPLATLPVERMPEPIYDWAMHFDAWDDMRAMGHWRTYEKETGENAPSRPRPFSFVLNLDDFEKHVVE